MRTIEILPWENEGKKYEIRLHGAGWDFTVRAFIDGKPANGYSYSVSLPTAIDLKHVSELDAVKVLIETAKRDISNRIWEQYVSAYVAGLSKEQQQTLGCRKCGERNINTTTIDERTMFECVNCGNVWYEERKLTNAYQMLVDEITEGVAQNGSHEIDLEILLNLAFRAERTGPSFEDQLENWASQNKQKYEIISTGGRQRVRFRRLK